jgi:hypothetical protein
VTSSRGISTSPNHIAIVPLLARQAPRQIQVSPLCDLEQRFADHR